MIDFSEKIPNFVVCLVQTLENTEYPKNIKIEAKSPIPLSIITRSLNDVRFRTGYAFDSQHIMPNTDAYKRYHARRYKQD